MNKKETIKAWVERHSLWTMFISLFILLLTISVYSWLHPFYYATGPITGTVVDKATGKPIERAVAVLQVTVEESVGNFHNTRRKAIYLDESVTDKEGRYRFPAWRIEHEFRSRNGMTVIAYRMGYKARGVTNKGSIDKRDFEFSGNNARIELEAYVSPQEEINAIKESLHPWSVGMGMHCAWWKVPNLHIEYDKRIKVLQEYLIQAGITEHDLSRDLVGRFERFQKNLESFQGCPKVPTNLKQYLDKLKKENEY